MNVKRRHSGIPIRALAVTAVLALTTGLPGIQAHASDAPVPATAVKQPPASEAEKAIAEAKKTQKNIPVDSLTTEFSETAATPDGHFALTSHMDQQRVRQDGVWKPLDATLAANRDGTFSPKSVAGKLVLSKGGDGPLATMTSPDGKKLSLASPLPLTTPTVSDDSVIYPSVAPDIDLKVTATKAGGFTTVFVVKTQAAAANPVLKNLHFDTATDGVAVTGDTHGNLTAAGTDGKPRWIARTPQMWDSAPPPAAGKTAPAAKSARTLAAAPADAPSDTGQTATTSSEAGPGTGSKVSDMPVKAGAAGIDLTPDQDLLAHGIAPYYIDPDWLPYNLQGNAWTWVQSAHDGPDSGNFNHQGSRGSDHPGVGVCGTYPNGGSCSPADKERSFFQFDIRPLGGAVIYSATMTMTEFASADWSCDQGYPLDLYVADRPISNSTTWSNQPGQLGGRLDKTAWIAGVGHGCPDNVPFSYDITGAMKQYVNYGQLTFGLYGDENNANGFKRINYQPSLTVKYDRVPDVPTNPGVWPPPRTVNPAGTNQACGDGNPNNWAWLGAGTNQDNAVWLNATVTSPTQSQVASADHLWDLSLPGSPNVADGITAAVGNGGITSFQVPGRVIQDGHSYRFNFQADDKVDTVPWSAPTPDCHFKVDLTPPTVTFPATVADTTKQFPPSGNGQTPQIYAGQSGGVPFTATDPAPSAGSASGVACLRWSFDPQFAGTAWQCGSAMPSGQIPVTPGRWGTNILYVQAEDNAGNLSPAAQYAFYVPWNPNSPAPAFGDVTGDSLPDILTADPNGDLRAYSIPATAPTAKLAAPKTLSPDHDSWANYRITHRGSLRGGTGIDDLIAHKDGNASLYYYQNPGNNTGVAGTFDASSMVGKPACDPKVTDCTGYNAADWSTTLQIAASGDPTTSKLDPNKKFANKTGLFTVESSPDGTGALWFYPAVGTVLLGSPTKLAATGWKGWDLIAPGDWTGQGRPGLWTRNQSTGELRGYTFTLGTVSVSDPFGGAITFPTFAAIATDTKIGTGITSAMWPVIGSDGDLTGTGAPTLWGMTQGGIIQFSTGHPIAGPLYNWDTAMTGVLSTYAENSIVTFAAQTGKCIDIAGAVTTNGTAVQLYDCNGSNAQKWSFEPDGTVRALGGCLDATGAGTANTTPLQIWTCGNALPNQIFLPRPDGSLYNPASGRCVDLPGGTAANTARLQLWDCNGSNAQKWNALVRS
ncbi:ricin-type beta-trefoil lectin domain protein [Kitasatospora sp. NPDC096128]|uniref:ricin-type beta-trefoil lectin domain protein n=1 Tax=Kitasatospora sp. NPDC096128 TaxID=3155547 RepID=UPI00331BFC6D